MSREDLANHLRIKEELHVREESKEHIFKIHVIEDGESTEGQKGNKKRPHKEDNNTRAIRTQEWFVGNATNRATT